MQTHPSLSNVTKTQLASLLTVLEEVPDPRVTATVDHDLPDLLTIACARFSVAATASTTWRTSARSGWTG